MLHVACMRAKDFSFAVQLANTMNWNMAEEDFEFMLKLEPHGCFVLFKDEEPVGIATCISYGKTGWFGNLAIKEEYRKKGGGTYLAKYAMNYLTRQGVETIGLYAYQHLIRFYNGLGFKPDSDFLVLLGTPKCSVADENVKVATRQDIPALIEFDRQCFNGNRDRLLNLILGKKGNLCYFSTHHNEIAGYVAAKVYDEMAELGPLVCRQGSFDVAIALLKTILSKLGNKAVFIYLPAVEKALLEFLLKAGFREEFCVTRMFSGPPAGSNCIYAAESLERG